jgi:hypothetical protein
MRKFQYLIAGALFASSAIAADVGVSISIGEPDFYGRIDIGDAPRPRLLYNEPVVIIREGYQAAPLYLRVRSGHAKHWKVHCHEYNACNRPVYFVRDVWYNDDYAPHYPSGTAITVRARTKTTAEVTARDRRIAVGRVMVIDLSIPNEKLTRQMDSVQPRNRS